MKSTLRVLALLIAVGAIVGWASLGAHRGWTKNSVTEIKIDPITELEYPEHRQQFVPGLELLGGALGVAGVLAAASFFIRNPKGKSKGKEPSPNLP